MPPATCRPLFYLTTMDELSVGLRTYIGLDGELDTHLSSDMSGTTTRCPRQKVAVTLAPHLYLCIIVTIGIVGILGKLFVVSVFVFFIKIAYQGHY